jgi:hypothetical protein
VARTGQEELAFEVKVVWKPTTKLNVKEDYRKLKAFRKKIQNSTSFLCVVGLKSCIKDIQLSQIPPSAFIESGWKCKPAYACLPNSSYGCRIYELLFSSPPPPP